MTKHEEHISHVMLVGGWLLVSFGVLLQWGIPAALITFGFALMVTRKVD